MENTGRNDDALARRRKWLQIVRENKSLEDAGHDRSLLDILQPEGKYGRMEYIARETAQGFKFEALYRQEKRTYWVPLDGAQTGDKGVEINRAYRIFGETDGIMTVKRVSGPEIDVVTQGCIKAVRRELGLK